MATTMKTKKKPTAAQLRARAAFSKIMKSGGFAKTRTKRKAKRNPVVATPPKIVRTSAVGTFKKNPTKRKAAAPKKDSQGRTIPRKGTNAYFAYMGVRAREVAGARRPTKRKANPTSAPAHFAVYRTSHGVKGRLIAKFTYKADAVQYATAYAKAHNCQVGITGKAR